MMAFGLGVKKFTGVRNRITMLRASCQARQLGGVPEKPPLHQRVWQRLFNFLCLLSLSSA